MQTFRLPFRRTIRIAAAIMISALPAHAGPPFVTDDPEPPEYGTWEINSALAGTLAHGGGDAALPVIDANYGALPDLQLHIQPQMAYVRTPEGTHFGFGDLEIGAKYRFIEEDADGWVPMVAFYPLFEIPTGDRRRALGAGVGRTLLPIWAQKTLGKWTVYGGGGYGINPGADGKNAWLAGVVALYQFTEKLQFGGEVYLQTAEAPGDKDAPGFNLGGSYGLAEDLNLLFSAGCGLANASENNRFSGYLGLQVIY
ncbi:MAG TPA: transporter [Alphaproteobacteria bacterium]|nr:transporter [Alphaproteobacteria bacterium]